MAVLHRFYCTYKYDLEVEGHPVRQVHLRSIRDHTIGIRNWFNFHRYCVHYIHVEEIFGSTVKPVKKQPLSKRPKIDF